MLRFQGSPTGECWRLQWRGRKEARRRLPHPVNFSDKGSLSSLLRVGTFQAMRVSTRILYFFYHRTSYHFADYKFRPYSKGVWRFKSPVRFHTQFQCRQSTDSAQAFDYPKNTPKCSNAGFANICTHNFNVFLGLLTPDHMVGRVIFSCTFLSTAFSFVFSAPGNQMMALQQIKETIASARRSLDSWFLE